MRILSLRARRSLLAMSMLASLPSCSLMGLDRFETPACTSDTQCAPRNVREGLDPSGCRAYRCLPNGDRRECTLGLRDDDGDGAPNAVCMREGRIDCDDTNRDIFPDGLSTVDGGLRDGGMSASTRELCDGVDNDCDTVIDENALALEAGVTWTSSLAAQHVRLAARADSLSVMCTADDAADPARHLTAAYDMAQDFTSLDALIPCGAAVDAGRCNVRAVSLDALRTGTAMAFVSTNGCADGRLHVRRWSGTEIAPPSQSSNIALGVDVAATDTPPCTRSGARHPVMTALEGSGADEPALLTWLGRESAGASPVRAIVVNFTATSVVVLGDPQGISLHETTLDAPPVVLKTGMHGWYVLSLQGPRVHLAFVSEDPATAPIETDVMLPLGTTVTALSGTLAGDNRTALVARDADNGLYLLVLALDVTASGLDARVVAGPTRLDAGTNVPRSAASVLYRETGFLDLTHATPRVGDGGLLVAFTEGANPDRIRLVRVADRDGAFDVLPEETSFALGMPNHAWEFALYEGNGRARLLTLRAASSNATVHDAALCGRR